MDVGSLHVAHHTEESFKIIHLTASHDVICVVTLASDTDVLFDQSDSIKLDSGHHLIWLLLKEKLDSNTIFRC